MISVAFTGGRVESADVLVFRGMVEIADEVVLDFRQIVILFFHITGQEVPIRLDHLVSHHVHGISVVGEQDRHQQGGDGNQHQCDAEAESFGETHRFPPGNGADCAGRRQGPASDNSRQFPFYALYHFISSFCQVVAPGRDHVEGSGRRCCSCLKFR